MSALVWKKVPKRSEWYASADGVRFSIFPDYRQQETGYSVYIDDHWSGFSSRLKYAKALAETMRPPRKNPIKRAGSGIKKDLTKAAKLRAGFRYTAGGRKNQPSKVTSRKAKPVATVQVVVGIVDALEYSVTDKSGRRIKGQSFRHEFTGKSCPVMTVSANGKQIYFVGGSYLFKTDGINDLK